MKRRYLWIAVIVMFCLVQILATYSQNSKGKSYLVPPPEYIEHFGFGFRESLADSFWLRWIQDVDTCQTYLSPVVYNPKDSETVISNFDLVSIPRNKICDNSWSFKMLDAVTKLAPRFEIPYLAGASALAILVEDYVGASVIYERGLGVYPSNWQLLYRASFHYQFNIKDLPRAADLLVRAADAGAPIWVKSLASRLYTVGGQVEMGIQVLESYRKTIDPENTEAVASVDRRLNQLRRQISR